MKTIESDTTISGGANIFSWLDSKITSYPVIVAAENSALLTNDFCFGYKVAEGGSWMCQRIVTSTKTLYNIGASTVAYVRAGVKYRVVECDNWA